MTRGRFITFEGGEGAGKSTQVRILAERLRGAGIEVVATREPGGSPGAETIRALLVTGDPDRWSAISETLLMYAARRDHIERTIRPALERGAWVISDRFADSSRAYQGAGGHAPQGLLAAMETFVLEDTRPDLTLMLDLPVEIGLKRAGLRGDSEARFEAKGHAFHQRLRDAFLEIAMAEPDRCTVLDAGQAPESVSDAIWSAVAARLPVAAPWSESPHPRDTFAYEGGEGVETAFLDAMARGRLHHAWLLTGPEGVGKATFAYRAARRLLGARPDADFGLLGAHPDDPVSRQIASRSHPDLMVLERATEDGKARKHIAVDDARKLPEFFAKAPASAPYRVAIIDAADDMNINAANALLKTLEEPPKRGVLFLVAHAPGGLIATIRSRCRRLAFPGWTEARVQAFVEARTGLRAEDAQRLTRMAKGAPGRAVAMAEEGALDAETLAQQILRQLPNVDEAALLAVADSFRGAEGQKRFEMLFDRLQDEVRAMAVSAAEAGSSAEIDRWARAWETLNIIPRDVEAVNLDRPDAFFTAIGRLREAARA